MIFPPSTSSPRQPNPSVLEHENATSSSSHGPQPDVPAINPPRKDASTQTAPRTPSNNPNAIPNTRIQNNYLNRNLSPEEKSEALDYLISSLSYAKIPELSYFEAALPYPSDLVTPEPSSSSPLTYDSISWSEFFNFGSVNISKDLENEPPYNPVKHGRHQEALHSRLWNRSQPEGRSS